MKPGGMVTYFVTINYTAIQIPRGTRFLGVNHLRGRGAGGATLICAAKKSSWIQVLGHKAVATRKNQLETMA